MMIVGRGWFVVLRLWRVGKGAVEGGAWVRVGGLTAAGWRSFDAVFVYFGFYD